MTSIDLITIGRRSGERRRVRLYAVVDGESYVVIGSGYAGEQAQPGWVYNLRADARARVRVGKRQLDVTVRELEDAERDRLWVAACDEFPYYAKLQAKASRRFGVFSLDPVEAQ